QHRDHNPAIQQHFAQLISHDRRDLNARYFRIKTAPLAALVASLPYISAYEVASPVQVTDRLLATSGRPVIADSSNGGRLVVLDGDLGKHQHYKHFTITL